MFKTLFDCGMFSIQDRSTLADRRFMIFGTDSKYPIAERSHFVDALAIVGHLACVKLGLDRRMMKRATVDGVELSLYELDAQNKYSLVWVDVETGNVIYTNIVSRFTHEGAEGAFYDRLKRMEAMSQPAQIMDGIHIEP